MPQPTLRPDPFRDAEVRDRNHSAVFPTPTPANTPTWTVRRRPASKSEPAQRRFEILWGAPNGDICDARLSAPALPVFESAFNGFARGALFQTDHGPKAVEDLLPGDRIATADGDVQTLRWIGAMELRRDANEAGNPEHLIRLTTDALGFGQPAPDLMLGTGARVLLRSDALKAYLGATHALAPVSALIDGVSSFEVTPPSRVRTYHICLERHAMVKVNGVECETFHPGLGAATQLGGDLRERFMALFPHLDDLGDFGAMAHPRLTPTDLIQLELV